MYWRGGAMFFVFFRKIVLDLNKTKNKKTRFFSNFFRIDSFIVLKMQVSWAPSQLRKDEVYAG